MECIYDRRESHAMAVNDVITMGHVSEGTYVIYMSTKIINPENISYT